MGIWGEIYKSLHAAGKRGEKGKVLSEQGLLTIIF